MKIITIVIPCFNEESNIRTIYFEIQRIFKELNYEYEYLFADNASEDSTTQIIKELALQDYRVKLIINCRNFGYIKSSYHALTQARGDAVVLISADLQEPPAMINQFLDKWQDGFKIVKGIKTTSKENFFIFLLRTVYYKFLNKISDTKLSENFQGFGLYDKSIIDILRSIEDPYPYLRGIIDEIGFDSIEIEYQQNRREAGRSSYLGIRGLYRLYDFAMLGITSYSKVPLRLATILGLLISVLSLLIGLIYLVAKLLFWNSFPLGTAPIIIGMFFFSAIQLMFIGIVGEYVGLMHVRILKRPLVIERERVNLND